jgi:hypothetical protein
VWMVLVRWIWRARLLERYLALNLDEELDR